MVQRNCMENHNVTLVKFTLQGHTTSACIIPKRQACQSHAVHIITKPKTKCKSGCIIADLHSFPLHLYNLFLQNANLLQFPTAYY